MAEFIKIADLREVDQQLTKKEISWGKAAEILSDRAENRMLDKVFKHRRNE